MSASSTGRRRPAGRSRVRCVGTLSTNTGRDAAARSETRDATATCISRCEGEQGRRRSSTDQVCEFPNDSARNGREADERRRTLLLIRVANATYSSDYPGRPAPAGLQAGDLDRRVCMAGGPPVEPMRARTGRALQQIRRTAVVADNFVAPTRAKVKRAVAQTSSVSENGPAGAVPMTPVR